MHERHPRSPHRKGRVLVGASIALATIVAFSTTTWAATGSGAGSGTSKKTVAQIIASESANPLVGPTIPSAPSGFAGQVTGLYSDIYGVAQATGISSAQPSGTQLPTVTQYGQQVDQLTPQQLTQFYQETQQVSNWSTLPSTFQNLQSEAQAQGLNSSPNVRAAALTAATTLAQQSAPPAATPSTGTSASPNVTPLTSGSAGPFPPAEPTGSFPNPPALYTPTSPIAPAVVPVCPAPAPGADFGAAAVYGTQVAVDTLTALVNGAPSKLGVIVAGTPELFPDPVRIIAAILGEAAQLVNQVFIFLNAANGDCGTVATVETLANIDNTTVNAYNLMTLLESTLDNVESSVNTVHAQLHVVQETADAQLTLGIEEALTAPAGSAPNAAYELPASMGGNLDSTPIGVQVVVTGLLQSALTAGLPVNPSAGTDLASGNAALGAGNYKQAYADYQASYQEAAL